LNKKKTTDDIQKDKQEPTDKIKKTEEKVNHLDNIPDEIKEFVKDAPPDVRGSFMAMLQTQSRQVGGHPLYEKFTPEHIDKFLDYCHKDDEYTYKLSSSKCCE